ncbi:Self-incompatibility protein [Parasponia andersonii]|uniref:S-protein homolog n=1 Tax=Parasponia andersonii TaxID=3476 RepID=A0A2P5AV05_PARAD|nr:Self-incompatibility protein [Parasponia andersonii]
MSNITLQIMMLLLVLVLTSTTTTVVGRTRVRIMNELQPEYLNLTAHCKSKDDDLGIQEISYGEFFEFGFKPNIWGTSLFFCSMKWDENNPPRYFDIYKSGRDKDKGSLCWWMIKVDGPCLLNWKTRDFDICYPWNN